MDWYDPRRILAFLHNPFPVVVDGKIHPGLLILARRAHWIQSRVLCIPNQFGLISSGPPLLQAHQAHKIASIISLDMIINFVASLLVHRVVLGTRWRVSAALMHVALLNFWYMVLLYIEEVFFNPMRAPDYDWEALYKRMGLIQSYAYVNSGP